MLNKICCFTSANYAYLNRARVLAETFKKYNPGIDVILILNDIKPEEYEMDMGQEPFDSVIQVDTIGIPDFMNWSFQHNVVELCTAVKASAAKYFLERYEKVFYLDPDIAVFDSLESILQKLDDYDIVLTPHQLTPCINRDLEIKDIELCSLKHGIFNLGFFAVANREQGKNFINWWESRLLLYCHEDVPAGIFTDQKWCDLAQVYYSRLYINRDFGCNVASWNLFERILGFKGGRLVVNDTDSLKFYHFTKYGGVGEDMTRRYMRNDITQEVWYWYGRKLREHSYNLPPDGYYFYGYYSSGKKIKQEDRILYRSIYKIGLPNPYIDN